MLRNKLVILKNLQTGTFMPLMKVQNCLIFHDYKVKYQLL